MKGHLGFRCRTCARPGPVRNLRQSGAASSGYSGSSGTVAWDAPLDAGSWPLTGYLVQQATGFDLSTGQFTWTGGLAPQLLPATMTTWSIAWCRIAGVVRVAAVNRCGQGPWAMFGGNVGDWTYTGSSGQSTSLVTASQYISLPCVGTSIKVWCVGPGGTWSGGGAGGSLAWKTWSVDSNGEWPSPSPYAVVSSSLASVTFAGQTVVAYGASGPNVGSYSGGDGGAFGNPGGDSYESYSGVYGGSITYPFSGAVQYSGRYNFGGGIGGQTGTLPNGSPIRPLPVSPCMRHPAADQSGLLSAVSLLGMRVTEECANEAAFGSGGVTFTMPTYGGPQRVNFAAGYGGGGFDSTNPGGPGCIVVQYS